MSIPSGACSCQITVCDNYATVGCTASGDFTNYFCDSASSSIYNNYNDYVYNINHAYVCGIGDTSTGACNCDSRQANASELTTETFPVDPANGYVDEQSYYDNTVPNGPCACDIYLTMDNGTTFYTSLGTDASPASCDGTVDIYGRTDSWVECGNGFTSADAPSGGKSCLCRSTTNAASGTATFEVGPVAVPTQIASRVISYSSSSGSSSLATRVKIHTTGLYKVIFAGVVGVALVAAMV